MTTTKKTINKQLSQTAQPKNIIKKAKQTVQKAGHKGGNAAMMGATAGVVVGAAVGGLAGAALTDKKTRQKISEFTKTAADTADRLSDKAIEMSDKANDITTQAQQAVNQFAEDTKDLQKKTRKAN